VVYAYRSRRCEVAEPACEPDRSIADPHKRDRSGSPGGDNLVQRPLKLRDRLGRADSSLGRRRRQEDDGGEAGEAGGELPEPAQCPSWVKVTNERS